LACDAECVVFAAVVEAQTGVAAGGEPAGEPVEDAHPLRADARLQRGREIAPQDP
jgi:hypothetical protein